MAIYAFGAYPVQFFKCRLLSHTLAWQVALKAEPHCPPSPGSPDTPSRPTAPESPAKSTSWSSSPGHSSSKACRENINSRWSRWLQRWQNTKAVMGSPLCLGCFWALPIGTTARVPGSASYISTILLTDDDDMCMQLVGNANRASHCS